MAMTVQTDPYPRGTPRHKQGERVRCPRNGATVTGAFCYEFCEAAEVDECGRFCCTLLEEAEADVLRTQTR